MFHVVHFECPSTEPVFVAEEVDDIEVSLDSTPLVSVMTEEVVDGGDFVNID